MREMVSRKDIETIVQQELPVLVVLLVLPVLPVLLMLLVPLVLLVPVVLLELAVLTVLLVLLVPLVLPVLLVLPRGVVGGLLRDKRCTAGAVCSLQRTVVTTLSITALTQ